MWNNSRRPFHTCSPGRFLMTYVNMPDSCWSRITEEKREIAIKRLFECFPSDSDPWAMLSVPDCKETVGSFGSKVFFVSLERSSAELRVRGVAEQTCNNAAIHTHTFSLQCPPPPLKCYIQVISIKADLCRGSCNNTAALCFPRPDWQ